MRWLLAISPEKENQNDASALALLLLTEDPMALTALVWSLERGYKFPEQNVLSMLSESVATEPHLRTVHTLLAFYIRMGDFKSATNLLDEHRELYEKQGDFSIWAFHRIQIAVIDDEKEIISDLISKDQDGSLNQILNRTMGTKAGWTEDRLATLDRCYRNSDSSADLFSACEAHHLAGKPNYVVEHADALLSKLPTQRAFFLVVDAAYASGDLRKCLTLTDAFRKYLPRNEMPTELRRLRAACLQALGRHSEAALELGRISRAERSASDKLNWFEAQFFSGDASGARQTAQELVLGGELTPEGLLHVASRIKADDYDLARRAFEEAQKGQITDPDLAARAYIESFSLGLEHFAVGLFETATKRIGQPGATIRQLTLPELIEATQEYQKARSERFDLYQRGAIPIHLLASSSEECLSYLTCIIPDSIREHRSRMSKSWSLRIRHGSIRRSQVRRLSPPTGGIFLDPTSILLLFHLDFLKLTERFFNVVKISSSTSAWIQFQINQLSSHQVSRELTNQELVKLIDSGLINSISLSPNSYSDHQFATILGEEWCELFEFARERGGFLVDIVPLVARGTTHDFVKLPEEFSPTVVTSAQILDASLRAGFITLKQRDRALDHIGRNASVSNSIILTESSTLVLSSGQAEVLAEENILAAIASRCKIFVSSGDISQIRRIQTENNKRRKIIDDLKTLRDRVRSNIELGKYLEITVDSVFESPSPDIDSTLLRCVRDTLDPERAKDSWTCIDDRCASAYRRVGASRIIGTLDLIFLFRHSELIDDNDLFDALHNLRSRNFRYIPTSESELTALLIRCVSKENRVIESAELSSLRRYFSGVFLNADDLQRPSIQAPRARSSFELRILLNVGSSAGEAIYSIWSNKHHSEGAKIAMSDWILESVWFDSAAAAVILGDFKVNQDFENIAAQHLLLVAVRLAATKGKTTEDYLRWLFLRLSSRPARWNSIIKEVKNLLLGSLNELKSKDENDYNNYLVLKIHDRFENALPTELRAAISLSEDDHVALGKDQFQLVGIGQFQFDGSALWDAASKSLQGNPESIDTVGGSIRSFRLEADINRNLQPILWFVSKDSDERYSWEEPGLSLLTNDGLSSDSVARRVKDAVDLSQVDFDKEMSRLLGLRDLDTRMSEYLKLERESFESQLRSVSGFLDREKRFCPERARPIEIKALLRNLRIAPGLCLSNLFDRIDAGAAALVSDGGFFEAFVRYAALPFPLPKIIHSEFRSLPEPEKLKFREYSATTYSVPLLAFHASMILSHGDFEDKSVAIGLIFRVIDDKKLSFLRYFKSILGWSYSCLINDCIEPSASLDCFVAAWIHAGRLHQTIGSPQGSTEVSRFFRENSPSLAGLAFNPEILQSMGSIHPLNFDPLALVFGCVSSILSELDLDGTQKESFGALIRAICFPYKAESNQLDFGIFQIGCNQAEGPMTLMDNIDFERLILFSGVQEIRNACEPNISKDIGEALSGLIENPANLDLWLIIAAVMGICKPQEAHVNSLRRALKGFDFREFEEQGENLIAVGMFIFNLSRFDSFRGEEFQWNSHLSIFGDIVLADSFGVRADKIIQACTHAAYSVGVESGCSDAENVERFVESLRLILGDHRSHIEDFRRTISGIANYIQGTKNAPLWKLLLELREL